MGKGPENDEVVTNSVVFLASTGGLSPDVFTNMLQRGDIGTTEVELLIRGKLLTPDLLVIWFSSYSEDPKNPSRDRPFSTIITALSSDSVSAAIIPGHLSSLATTNQRLWERGVYATMGNGWVYQKISTLLNEIKTKKAFITSSITYEEAPNA